MEVALLHQDSAIDLKLGTDKKTGLFSITISNISNKWVKPLGQTNVVNNVIENKGDRQLAVT